MRICPKCHYESDNDKALFCRKCGTRLPEIESEENTENPEIPENTSSPYDSRSPYRSGSPYDSGSPYQSKNSENPEEAPQASPGYSIEEGDHQMVEYTGSGDSSGYEDDTPRFYDEDDPVVVPPPPPVFGGNTTQGTSFGNTSEPTQPEYVPQPTQPEYTPQPTPTDYSQQYVTNNGPIPKKPDNHLLKSILTTFLCVPILGVVAIVYSAQVDSSYNAGFYDEAEEKSRKANSWGNAAIVVGIILYVIIILLVVITAIAAEGY